MLDAAGINIFRLVSVLASVNFFGSTAPELRVVVNLLETLSSVGGETVSFANAARCITEDFRT